MYIKKAIVSFLPVLFFVASLKSMDTTQQIQLEEYSIQEDEIVASNPNTQLLSNKVVNISSFDPLLVSYCITLYNMTNEFNPNSIDENIIELFENNRDISINFFEQLMHLLKEAILKVRSELVVKEDLTPENICAIVQYIEQQKYTLEQSIEFFKLAHYLDIDIVLKQLTHIAAKKIYTFISKNKNSRNCLKQLIYCFNKKVANIIPGGEVTIPPYITLLPADLQNVLRDKIINFHTADIWQKYNASEVAYDEITINQKLTALILSPDNTLIISGTAKGKIIIFDATTLTILKTIDAHNKPISSIDISKDGKFLASAADERNPKIWNLSDYTLIHELKEHLNKCTLVKFSNNGKFLISTSKDRNGCLWDVPTGKKCFTFSANDGEITSVDISQDNTTFAFSSAEDRDIYIYNIETKTQKILQNNDLESSRPPIACVKIIGNTHLLIMYANGEIVIRNIATGKIVSSFQNIYELASSKIYQHLALLNFVTPIDTTVFNKTMDLGVIIYNNILSLWHIRSDKILHQLLECARDSQSLAISSNSQFILCISQDHTRIKRMALPQLTLEKLLNKLLDRQ